jgi:hypothetical protein
MIKKVAKGFITKKVLGRSKRATTGRTTRRERGFLRGIAIAVATELAAAGAVYLVRRMTHKRA